MKPSIRCAPGGGHACLCCGGTGVLRNLSTCSPSDNDPCPCTYADDDDDAAQRGPAADRRDDFHLGSGGL